MSLRDWLQSRSDSEVLRRENRALRSQVEEFAAIERALRLQLRIARATSRPVPKERQRWTHPSTAGSATSGSSTRSPIPAQRRTSERSTPRRGNSPHSHGSDHTPYGGTTR